MQIAIDGPAGAGKSTIAKKVAKKLSCIYLDTGALYRCVAFYFVKNEIDYTNQEYVEKFLDNIKIKISFENNNQVIFLNGENITTFIRDDNISMVASRISSFKCVRDFLISTQRNIAEKSDIVMDGRDIGTVVLPNATYKFFITASIYKRAYRRHMQLKSLGKETDFNGVLRDMRKRDRQDEKRLHSPLKMADDAVLIDNSNLNLSKSVRFIMEYINEKEGQKDL